jgi:hypothetical protein
LRALRESLIAADSPDAVTGVFFLFEHSRARFSRTFRRIRPALVGLIGDLLKWLEAHLSLFSIVEIHGV